MSNSIQTIWIWVTICSQYSAAYIYPGKQSSRYTSVVFRLYLTLRFYNKFVCKCWLKLIFGPIRTDLATGVTADRLKRRPHVSRTDRQFGPIRSLCFCSTLKTHNNESNASKHIKIFIKFYENQYFSGKMQNIIELLNYIIVFEIRSYLKEMCFSFQNLLPKDNYKSIVI